MRRRASSRSPRIAQNVGRVTPLLGRTLRACPFPLRILAGTPVAKFRALSRLARECAGREPSARGVRIMAMASKASKSAARALRPAAVAVVALVIAACATNPATGKREFSLMSEAQEIQLGQEMDGRSSREMGVYDDAELQRYVESVGMRLARASRAAEPAVAFRRRRRARGQRLRAARRLHLSDARHPRRSSTTKRSSPACSVTRSATSPRAIRRSSTRRRRAPASA